MNRAEACYHCAHRRERLTTPSQYIASLIGHATSAALARCLANQYSTILLILPAIIIMHLSNVHGSSSFRKVLLIEN